MNTLSKILTNQDKLIFSVIFSFLIFLSTVTKAQPECGNNPSANDICGNATPICNLNGYCGNTSASYTNWVSSTDHTSETNTPLGSIFCATIQNNSWIKFIANSTSAVFSIWVSNCSDGKGVQMQIYSTSDCYHFTAVSNCWNPLTPTNGQITATGLTPGQVYYFMIDGTQGDNCDYIIAANSGVTTAPTISDNQTICRGQTATISATNANSYQWSSNPNDPSLANQSTNASIDVSPTTTTIYTVSVTQNGANAFCANNNNVLSTVVTVNQLPILNVTSTLEHCHLNDATASIFPNGDTLLYQYSWNTSPIQTTRTATHLAEGTYTVSVRDMNGCLSTFPVTIENVTYLTPNILGTPKFCSGESTVLNAGSNYDSYQWSTGSNEQTLLVNQSGTYSVTVTMGNNCLGTDSAYVIENQNPTPIINGSNFICPTYPAILHAGTGYSSYLWTNGYMRESISVFTENTYSVTVTDSNDCRGIASFYVHNNNGPFLTTSSKNEICNRMDGSADVLASGGNGSYLYSWSNGANAADNTDLSSGKFYVTVSDDNCTVSDSVVVHETLGPTADFWVNPSILILNEDFVSAYFTDNSSGTIVYRIWDFGDTTGTETGLFPSHNYYNLGYYPATLIVIDTNNCIDSTVKIIHIKDYFTCYIPNSFTPNEDNINDLFSPSGTNWRPDNFEMYIFDRWGKLFFKSTDIQHTSWNGTEFNKGSSNNAVIGTYNYLIKIKDDEENIHQFIGTIYLYK